nr:transporter [Streptomyces sp. SID5468]
MRRSPGRAAGYVIGSVLALVPAVGVLLGMIALRAAHPAHTAPVGCALLVVLALCWAFVPLFFFGGDETLDPTRLVMLPLRPWPMVGGLLAASLVGVGPLFTLITVAGAMLAVTMTAAAVPVAVVAAALTLLLCVTLARSVAAANTRLLTSRKGRDLALMSGLIVAVGIQLANLAVQKLTTPQGVRFLDPLAHVLRWVPPGSAVDAVHAASAGQWGRAAVGLALTAAATGLLLWWWGRSLTRLMTAPDASTVPAAASGPDAERRSARAGSGGRLVSGRTGTVMERQFRYAWRDPRTKAAWATSLGIGLLMPVVWAAQGTGSMYSVCMSSGLLGMQVYNQFGMDGSAFWLVSQTIGSRAAAEAELRGRALAIAVVAVPYTCVAAVLTAAMLHGWATLPESVGLALALLGSLLGLGAPTSVRFPYAVPQNNSFQSAVPGQTSLVLSNLLAGTVAAALVTAPVLGLLIGLHLAGLHGLLWLVLPVGAGYGAVVAVLGIRVAATWLPRRLPEILTAVSKA